MARQLAPANITAIDSRHTHPVAMAKLEFDTPVYLHSGLGTIVYGGHTYLGVGSFGGISGVEESEDSLPAAITLELSGISSSLFSEALNSANYGDVVTVYVGYRDDSGDLIDEPWVMYKGRVERSNLVRGSENSIQITIQHELAILNQAINAKYTDEEQQRRYPGDTAFARVDQMELINLRWGGKDVNQYSGGRGGRARYRR